MEPVTSLGPLTFRCVTHDALLQHAWGMVCQSGRSPMQLPTMLLPKESYLVAAAICSGSLLMSAESIHCECIVLSLVKAWAVMLSCIAITNLLPSATLMVQQAFIVQMHV